MEEFKIDQLTKELIAAKLRQLPDPCQAAAQLVKETLRVALKTCPVGSSGDQKVIEQACQGAMTALLLNDQNLAKGAVLMLEAVVDVAGELNMDQVELMRAALRGMSDVKRFVQPHAVSEIAAAIEAHFHDAGAAFQNLCRAGSGVSGF